MRTAERICIGVALLGIVWRFLHWPGAGLMIVFSISLLSILYFIMGWMLFRAKNSRITLLALAIPAGFALAITLVGILFKLQHWPGSEMSLGLGSFLCLLVIAPLAYRFMKRDQGGIEQYSLEKHHKQVLDTPQQTITVENGRYKYARNVLRRALITGCLGAFLFFIPWSAYNKFWYYDDPKYGELMTKAMEDPGNEEHWKALDEYRQQKNDSLNSLPPTIHEENK